MKRDVFLFCESGGGIELQTSSAHAAAVILAGDVAGTTGNTTGPGVGVGVTGTCDTMVHPVTMTTRMHTARKSKCLNAIIDPMMPKIIKPAKTAKGLAIKIMII